MSHRPKQTTDVASRLTSLEADVSKLRGKQKDAWDRLSVITTFVATVLLVAVGGIYTAAYKAAEAQRQADWRDLEKLRIQEESTRRTRVEAHEGRIMELEVVASVLPYLEEAKTEHQKLAFYTLIQALATQEIAQKLSFLQPGRSTLLFADQSAQTIINSPDASDEAIQAARRHFESTVVRRLEAQPYYDESSDRQQTELYYEGLDLRSGTQVDSLTLLHDLLARTHVSLSSYKTARVDFLYPIIDIHPDGSLRSIYGNQRFSPDGKRLTTGGSLEHLRGIHPFNAEAVVPASWFAKRNPMRTDLHNLFTCEWACNSYRVPNRTAMFLPAVHHELIVAGPQIEHLNRSTGRGRSPGQHSIFLCVTPGKSLIRRKKCHSGKYSN